MDSTRYSSPFLCSVSDAIRVRHYSRSTEKTYNGMFALAGDESRFFASLN